MTLKTALVIGGDSSGAQAAVAELIDDVQELGTASQRAAVPARELAASQGAVANSARGASAAAGGLYQSWQASAGSANQLKVSYGALAPAIDDTARRGSTLGGILTQVNVGQLLVREGGEALAGVFAGALAGGIAGVVSGAVALVAQLAAEAYAAAQAESASAALAQSLAALDAANAKVAKSAQQVAIADANAATAALYRARANRELLRSRLEEARSDAALAERTAQSNPDKFARLAAAGSRDQVSFLTGELAKLDQAVAVSERTVRVTAIPVFRALAQGAVDPAAQATNRFEAALRRLDAAQAQGKVGRDAYITEYARLTRERDAASAAAGRATGATATVARAHAAGAGAAQAQAAAARAAAEAQRELASDLAGVIGRYDPARKAAADYAEELERIARLEAVGEGKGGLSQGDAARYRDGAFGQFAKARADAFVLPDVAAAGAAAGAIDEVAAALRGEIEALLTLDPIQRELLKYREQLAALAPEERAAAEERLRGLLTERAATEDVNAAAREAADAKRQLLDAARGALDAIISGGEKAGDVVDRLARSLAAAAVEAAVFGTGPLAGVLNGAIGSGRRGGGGAAGAIGTDAVGKAVEKGAASALDRAFGTNGSFRTTLKNAGYGSAAASLTGGNAMTGALGGAVGGKVATDLLTKTLGSWAGPIGSVVGGVVFGAIGGLLKKTKSGSATIGDTTGAPATAGNSASYRRAAGQLAGGVQDTIAQIAAQLGGAVGSYAPITIGKYGESFKVNTTGKSTLKKGKAGVVDFDEDQEAAEAYAVQLAIARGAVVGLSDRVAKALSSSTDITKAVAEAVKVQELEVLLGGVSGTLEKAFRDFDAVARERLRVAQAYGFDVVAIEKRNAEDRAKIATDLAKSQVGSLQQLLDEMDRGSLFAGTALDRVAALNTAITKAQADLDAGVDGAGDTLAKLLTDRLGALEDSYGTTGAYAAGRADTADRARAAIAQANARIAAAGQRTDPALKKTNDTLDEMSDQNAKMVDALRSIDANIAGGSGGGIAGRLLNLGQLAAV